MNSPFPALVGKTIVLGLTGSISAYKAADLASKLRQAGAEVWPVMTAGAQRFVTPLTLQAVAHHPVACDLWSENDPTVVAHVDLADRADLLLVAPATANTIAQFAHGLAPDFLSSLYLVCLLSFRWGSHALKHRPSPRHSSTLLFLVVTSNLTMRH